MPRGILMSEFVTDTMGLVLRIERRKLGPVVKSIFESAESGSATINVPAIVLAEILYLYEKRRISISPDDVANYFTQHRNYKEYPTSFAVIESAAQITDVRELHNRSIAGTARLLDLELITNDPVIQASAFVKTVW